MRKTFQTGRLNDLAKQKRRSWLLFPAIMLVFFVLFCPIFLINDSGGHYIQGFFRFLVLDAELAIGFGTLPFYFIRARIRGASLAALHNASFITVQNFDYYREKLQGLAPGAISLLEDLKLEPDKDVAACILRYEMLGLIRENGTGGYDRTGIENPNAHLRRSDSFLIERIVSGNVEYGMDKWRELAANEAKEDRLIEDKPFTNQTPKQIKRANTRFLYIWLLSICLFMALLFPSVLRDYCEENSDSSNTAMYETVLSALPDWMFLIGDMRDEINDISEEADWHHGASSYEKEEYLFSVGYHWKLGTMLCLEMIILMIFLFPIFYLRVGVVRMKETASYRRTERGNELTEYIWGMKNFIHDFSNLNEATKTALALWDDYLIYAVVLEENTKIVDEIKLTRRNAL